MNENEGKYIPSQEEQQKTPEQTKADFALSPEIEKLIMEKVQDINEEGTAFHTLGANNRKFRESFQEVIKHGLLGRSPLDKDSDTRTPNEAWPADARAKKYLPMYFNILGRTDSHFEMDTAFWPNFLEGSTVSIIFDLSKFKDAVGTRAEYNEKLKRLKEEGSEDPAKDEYEQNKPGKFGYYWPHDSSPYQFTHRADDARSTAAIDYGFKLFSRVAPRLFKGIVIKEFRALSDEEYVERLREKAKRRYPESDWYKTAKPEDVIRELHLSERKEKYVEITDLEVLKEKAQALATTMMEIQPKRELLVPIYDIKGNLLWPKQLSYKEVKEYLASKQTPHTEDSK